MDAAAFRKHKPDFIVSRRTERNTSQCAKIFFLTRSSQVKSPFIISPIQPQEASFGHIKAQIGLLIGSLSIPIHH
jgi:hypothetical protein